jgi:hypothetical protein
MNSTKLAPALLLIPLALTTLACPTRPIDKPSGSGGAGGEAGSSFAGAGDSSGGHGGGPAGEGGAAGNAAGHGGSATGEGGAAGSGAPVAGAGGTTGGTAGAAGSLAGAAGGAAGAAGSSAGASGGAAGAAGGAAGAAGGTTGLGGTAGTSGALADGQPCSLATNCTSQVCTAFYVDVDGDGYGTGQAVGFCGTTVPVGYASQSGDCCDNATNLAVAKLIHPGQNTYQSTSAGGVCGITWDYDCSGAIETQSGQLVGCGPDPTCQTMLTQFPDSECGQSVNYDGCKPDSSSGTCSVGTNFTLPLGCK